MQSKPNCVFLELLKLPSVELLQVKNKETLSLYKGLLQVIRNDTLDLVLLKLDEIKLPLNNSLPVIGARSGQEKFPAYLMPTFDGFYMIRILDSNPGVVLTNFETILESTCEFHRRTGMEKKLGEIKEPTIESKLGVAKDIIHKTKEVISKNIMPIHERHPNYILIRTYNELINVDSPSVPVIDVPTQEVENVTAEVEEIVRNQLSNKYWTHFSELEGVPIKRPVLKTMRSTNPAQQFEQQRPRAPSFGAENIATVKKDIDFDSQEIVGTENQRLPAYEVQATKEHVVQGLASCEAKYYQNYDEKKKQEIDDESLTCDLMRSKECKRRADEPAPILGSNVGRENIEIIEHVPLEKERIQQRNIPGQAKENIAGGQVV